MGQGRAGQGRAGPPPALPAPGLAQATVTSAQPCLQPPARALRPRQEHRAGAFPALVLSSLGQGRKGCSPLLSSSGRLGLGWDQPLSQHR